MNDVSHRMLNIHAKEPQTDGSLFQVGPASFSNFTVGNIPCLLRHMLFPTVLQDKKTYKTDATRRGQAKHKAQLDV